MRWARVVLSAAALVVFPATLTTAQVCDNFANTCQTTPLDACDSSTNQIKIQLGGLGSVNNNGVSPGQLDDGTKATAIVTITKVDADTIDVELENTTCTEATLTALFYNITQSVTAMDLQSINPTPEVSTWGVCYDQTTAAQDGHGLKAGGFGYFDGVIGNSKSQGACDVSPNGGDPNEIDENDPALTFRIDITGAWDICDFLKELSEPNPKELLRTMAARFQSGEQGGSGRIAPCTPSTPLLAHYRSFKATPGNDRVLLEWSTSLEIDNLGFNVLRRAIPRGTWEWINPSFILGQGDTVTGADYSFVDSTALNGVEYKYYIEDIDLVGVNNLSHPAQGVANPHRPDIRLLSPAYGAQVGIERGLAIGVNSGLRGNFTVQISSFPTFPATDTVVARVPVRSGQSAIRLNPHTTRQMQKLAGDGDGLLYWRFVNKKGGVMSDTFRMEVK